MGGESDGIPIFYSPSFPIFPEVGHPPHSPLYKNQLTALPDGEMGIFATHGHSPRLVRKLGRAHRLGVSSPLTVFMTDWIHFSLDCATSFTGLSARAKDVPVTSARPPRASRAAARSPGVLVGALMTPSRKLMDSLK